MARRPRHERPQRDPDDASGRRPVDLTADRLARQLRPDPGTPSGAVAFTGYLGASERPDRVRLYVDPELRSWLEVARDDVLHRDRVGAPPEAADATVLWVRRTATVGRDARSAAQLQAELLEGEVIRRYLPDSVTDEQVAGFFTKLVCATIAITWHLCVTPSCEDISVPLLCDEDDDGEGEGRDDEPGDTGADDDVDVETPTR